MSRHRSSVGLRWPSKRIAALHRLPIRSVWAARCALRCAPMAARSLRHLIGDATLVRRRRPCRGGRRNPRTFPCIRSARPGAWLNFELDEAGACRRSPVRLH
ncbi:hypothetical protein [Verminephrobacter eiseniae]|uniref:hypothetical protein n=1 Tax=Verminephrobacter eiseniae TaxID=364317 RepID=UPI00223789D6|nr:hypothetical protein [Verminephrobacter eiseniae]